MQKNLYQLNLQIMHNLNKVNQYAHKWSDAPSLCHPRPLRTQIHESVSLDDDRQQGLYGMTCSSALLLPALPKTVCKLGLELSWHNGTTRDKKGCGGAVQSRLH
jgi:hypothetical protein